MQKPGTATLDVEAPSLLPANKSRELLKDLDGWQSTDDHKMIYREFILHDFMGAVDLIDQIATIAQGEKHHPDIHLTQYRNLRVALTTHDVGGLSDKDFTVASKINEARQHPQHKNINAAPKKNSKTKATPTKKNRLDQHVKKVKA